MTNGEPAAAFLSLRSVSRRFGPVTAVDGVTLDIRRGEFFSLLGPSGCGKSTLMRMIAGFETPDEGSLFLDGTDLAGSPAHQRPVNMMFQSYALFPHLTVADNIAFGLRRMGMEPAAMQARLSEMLTLTQLQGLEKRKPSALSGGQRQRVALARALARDPKVLLLDEPLGALDRKLRKETQAELKRLQATSGATFLIVTHDQEEAMALSDRIAVMNRGRIVQVGPPQEIYDQPANRFTAGFLGEINLVGAQGTPDGRWRVKGLAEPLHAAAAASAQAGDASLGLRPERLRITDRDAAQGPGWPCRVVGRTPYGHAVGLELAAADGLMLSALAPASDKAAHFQPGRDVFASFAPADARVIGD